MKIWKRKNSGRRWSRELDLRKDLRVHIVSLIPFDSARQLSSK
jgi:hypothetical protein